MDRVTSSSQTLSLALPLMAQLPVKITLHIFLKTQILQTDNKGNKFSCGLDLKTEISFIYHIYVIYIYILVFLWENRMF